MVWLRPLQLLSFGIDSRDGNLLKCDAHCIMTNPDLEVSLLCRKIKNQDK